MPGEANFEQLWLSEYLTPSHRVMHAVRRVVATAKTEFQAMQIVETADFGKALLLDGTWQSATADEFIYHESLVHPAMLTHGAPKRVLILGGGEGATSREVLRWSTVERVVMVDIDGEVVEACREHLPEMHQGAFDDPRHELVVGDALAYLGTTDERWDVVISDLSDPVEDGPAFQLFTREYFERVRAVMSERGAFAVQAGPVTPGEMGFHVGLVNTVKAAFGHAASYQAGVPSFGSPWGFCLASAHGLDDTPDPARTDRILEQSLRGELRYLDGAMVRAQKQNPPYLKQALAAETRVYTSATPPVFGS
ncbi:MAG: polyamine aminopropyltransferase [Myxococcota bacterium]